MTQPACALASVLSSGINVEKVKRDGWNQHRILVIQADDPRIKPIERAIIEQLGRKLYGGDEHG